MGTSFLLFNSFPDNNYFFLNLVDVFSDLIVIVPLLVHELRSAGVISHSALDVFFDVVIPSVETSLGMYCFLYMFHLFNTPPTVLVRDLLLSFVEKEQLKLL
mgnify:FL=1